MFSSRRQTDSPDVYLQVTSQNSLNFVSERDVPQVNGHASLTPFFFEPVPVNFCEKDLLVTISGIGPGLAENILRTRQDNGYFQDKFDLLLVSGIGESRMNRFAASLSFSTSR